MSTKNPTEKEMLQFKWRVAQLDGFWPGGLALPHTKHSSYFDIAEEPALHAQKDELYLEHWRERALDAERRAAEYKKERNEAIVEAAKYASQDVSLYGADSRFIYEDLLRLIEANPRLVPNRPHQGAYDLVLW